jgi:hypothetical protein
VNSPGIPCARLTNGIESGRRDDRGTEQGGFFMGTHQPLLIRFRGICAHLDLDPPKDAARGKRRKRTLLVRHRNGNSNIEHHVPYIECLADDVLDISSGLRLLQYSRPGTDGRFARVDLADQPDTMTLIRINGVPPGDVTEDLSYQENVPHFGKILNHRDDATPADSLIKASPPVDGKFATAVFDMPEGLLVAGEPEAMKTRFDSGPSAPEEKARRFSRWSDLYVQVPAGEVTVELVQQPDGEPQTITFAKTVRMITIGNEPERLILGLIGGAHSSAGHDHNHASGNGHGNGASGRGPIQPTGHFVLYYDVLKNRPDQMPLPVPSQLEGTGCPNNNIP